MPEAEDVILEAAERVHTTVRDLWTRHRDTERDRHADEAAAARRLVAWQLAWIGRAWPITATAPPAGRGLVVRTLRRMPPWVAHPPHVPFTDGRRIGLPREWLAAATDTTDPTNATGADAPDRALVAVLTLAWRLARRPDAPMPEDALARDALWVIEGALADAALAEAWPGLAPALERLRAEALATRPDAAALRPPERAIEERVRAILGAPLDSNATSRLLSCGPDTNPETVAERAMQWAAALADEEGASGYRGYLPVAHWGVAWPPGRDAAAGAAHPASPQRDRPGRSAALPRAIQRREPEADDDPRPGPFVLPFADPHLSVDDPAGLQRPPDTGHDEDLDALADELARLDSLVVVHDDTPVRETLTDEGAGTRAAPHAETSASKGGVVFQYPEWDVARDAYRDPGCLVRELPASVEDHGWSDAALARRRALIVRLRDQLESLRPRRERERRQTEGDDLDLAGLVDDWAERHAERAPAGRVYTRDRPRRRDVAVTLLLDASGSTESWLSGGQRVIDVVKETALVFGEALSTLGDRFAIHAFSGQGAGDVRVRVLKRFDEPAGPAVRRRIGALEPDAFTRLGGALRHAATALAREHARVRLVLLLSDGKPQDEDVYEGRYGIEDVRQAVAEARLQGVHVFGVTIDREGPGYLPRLFGPSGYTVIDDAAALPERLPRVYRRLTAGA